MWFVTDGRPLPGASPVEAAGPFRLVLAGAHPARGAARLSLTLDAPLAVRVAAYDALGREVAVLHDGTLGVGAHALSVGAGLPAGVYVVRAESAGGVAVRRVVLL